MADRSCDYCDDRGNCERCSPFFQPNAIHSKCGNGVGRLRRCEHRDQSRSADGVATGGNADAPQVWAKPWWRTVWCSCWLSGPWCGRCNPYFLNGRR